MEDIKIQHIDDLLKYATEEYKSLNDKNLNILDKLRLSVDALDPEALEVFKTSIDYQLKTGIEDLSENKFRIWYIQKCLNESILQTNISELELENKKALKQIKDETDLCQSMSKIVKDMEILVDENCRELETKNQFRKNSEKLSTFQESINKMQLVTHPNLEIDAIENRIQELETLRKKLNEEKKKSENKKILESCMQIAKDIELYK